MKKKRQNKMWNYNNWINYLNKLMNRKVRKMVL